MDFWDSFTGTEQTLFAMGVTAFVLFAIQTLISLLFAETDTDVDIDTDSDGFGVFELFTIRNAITFVTGFSWISLGFIQMGWPEYIAMPIGLMFGGVFTSLNLFVLGLVASLSSRGNIDLNRAVGAEGQVTVSVPGENNGQGKVNISFSGRAIELVAQTSAVAALSRGAQIRVTAVNGDQVTVEPVL